MGRKIRAFEESAAELDELVEENASLEQELARITKEKEFIQTESEKLKKGISEMEGTFQKINKRIFQNGKSVVKFQLQRRAKKV